MKVACVLLALVALAGLCSAVDIRHLADQANAGARCGTQANGAACPQGSCCSKYGFCGTLPFHCDKSKGCQSQCREEEQESTQPQAVVPADKEDNVQIIVKTISNAVPLLQACEDCSAAAARAGVDTTPVDQAEDSVPAPLTGSAGLVGSTSTTDAGGLPQLGAAAAVGGDVSVGAAAASNAQLASIKSVQDNARAEADRIIAEAKAAAQQLTQANRRGVVIPTAGTQSPSVKGSPLSDINVLDRNGY